MSGSASSSARLVHVVAPRLAYFDQPPLATSRPKGTVVWLAGELDVSSVEDVVNDLIRIAGARRRGSLVLDLSRVVFMDAAGLKGLLILRSRLAHRAQVLTLRNIPEPVLMVLKASGCLGAFEVLGERPAAGDLP